MFVFVTTFTTLNICVYSTHFCTKDTLPRTVC